MTPADPESKRARALADAERAAADLRALLNAAPAARVLCDPSAAASLRERLERMSQAARRVAALEPA